MESRTSVELENPHKYVVRIELEYPEYIPLTWEEVKGSAEYLLTSILSLLHVLGMNAKQVEIFDTQNPDHYAELLQEDIAILNKSLDEETEDEKE